MKLLFPIIASTFVGLANTAQVSLPASEASFWAGVVERWGIAGVMFICLIWATKRIEAGDKAREAGDKARLEVVKQNAEQLERYHLRMEEMLGNSNKVNSQVASAIYSLANEMEKRPCNIADMRKTVERELRR